MNISFKYHRNSEKLEGRYHINLISLTKTTWPSVLFKLNLEKVKKADCENQWVIEFIENQREKVMQSWEKAALK